jgi:hypothetical protein
LMLPAWVPVSSRLTGAEGQGDLPLVRVGLDVRVGPVYLEAAAPPVAKTHMPPPWRQVWTIGELAEKSSQKTVAMPPPRCSYLRKGPARPAATTKGQAMSTTMRTGHHRLADGSLVRVDIELGHWVGRLYTPQMTVQTQIVGSDAEVHAWVEQIAA